MINESQFEGSYFVQYIRSIWPVGSVLAGIRKIEPKSRERFAVAETGEVHLVSRLAETRRDICGTGKRSSKRGHNDSNWQNELELRNSAHPRLNRRCNTASHPSLHGIPTVGLL
ncbi:hypothetical protein MGG_16650 [Pyricularia oryzae 70-15]|uniref:Uncharacterized protein n=3 Tax=Pyricularia oryzae TaxID=318829 RepID=G4N1P7_PYRO7|nr:uncharacterized protein MGG_16650 [Pyricularia oryzae 70-15]EHA51619.1 hypothetical protein MGG_16650 [Pyricularia oryzae 70-15]ELQ38067.1 hypothetical protein OOU_Y34scaffold00552g21 [Pyricularia oryzae Y34]